MLIDLFFLGGALGGAALLFKPQPFFRQFLEEQKPAPPAQPPQPPSKTPDALVVTKAYPSDKDVHSPMPTSPMTEAYPSDDDHHLPRPIPRRERGHSQLLPLWKRLA